jgi:hypothetical protein
MVSDLVFHVEYIVAMVNFHAMKTYRGSGGMSSTFLTLALDGIWWSVSLPDRFIPGKERPVPTGQ